MESNLRYVTFTFLDNSKMKLVWPKQGSKDPQVFASQVKKSLEEDVFTALVEGQLVVIPMRNVKYMIISPAPETLPQAVIRNAKITA
jgi:hypothetical protein